MTSPALDWRMSISISLRRFGWKLPRDDPEEEEEGGGGAEVEPPIGRERGREGRGRERERERERERVRTYTCTQHGIQWKYYTKYCKHVHISTMYT